MSFHADIPMKKKKKGDNENKRAMSKVIIKPTATISYLGNDVKKEVLELPASYRVNIKICEMGADMAKLALIIVVTCLKRHLDFGDIAQELKTCFDAACPIAPWQAVVGEAFYSIATHRKGYYLFFCINKIKVILYKCRDGD